MSGTKRNNLGRTEAEGILSKFDRRPLAISDFPTSGKKQNEFFGFYSDFHVTATSLLPVADILCPELRIFMLIFLGDLSNKQIQQKLESVNTEEYFERLLKRNTILAKVYTFTTDLFVEHHLQRDRDQSATRLCWTPETIQMASRPQQRMMKYICKISRQHCRNWQGVPQCMM